MPRNSARQLGVACLLGLLILLADGAAPAVAQYNGGNNTGYPPGTDCQDLIEPRRAKCRAAIDPRPNPRETINKPRQKPLLPRAVPSLDNDAMPTNPKRPSNLPPRIPKALQ
ncbi:MAG: hypothetical protein IPK59_17050 [Rhodospirillaceae bacterium]|nr:hypothetical protein [Rhodospirillaceae bacterium]